MWNGEAEHSDSGDCSVQQTLPTSRRNLVPAKLLISYIPARWSEFDIRDLCRPYGALMECKVPMNRELAVRAPENKGYAFVTFTCQEDADRAMASVNGIIVSTRVVYEGEDDASASAAAADHKKTPYKTLRVVQAREPAPDIVGAKIIVRNLPPNWTDEEVIEEHYSRNGTVTVEQVRLVTARNTTNDESDPPARYAFVLFSSKFQADAAVNSSLDGEDALLRLTVTIHSPVEKRPGNSYHMNGGKGRGSWNRL